MSDRDEADSRYRLENRRGGCSIDFDFRGSLYVLGVGFAADGKPYETFISVQPSSASKIKVGSDTEQDARDIAILISLALQYGADPIVLKSAITRNERDEPAGIAGKVLDILCGLENQKWRA